MIENILSIFLNMKLTLQIQLLPDATTGQKLKATIERFNEAANWLAPKAYERKLANKFALQKLYYSDLRHLFGLSAQMAIRCIAQVVEAYKRDKKVQPAFRKHASIPYDQRLYSFKGIDRVSLLTLEGRVLVPMLMGNYQREQFGYAKGQADLVLRKDGKWFLLVSVDVPDGTPIPTTDFIGVDLGTTSLKLPSAFMHERQAQLLQRWVVDLPIAILEFISDRIFEAPQPICHAAKRVLCDCLDPSWILPRTWR